MSASIGSIVGTVGSLPLFLVLFRALLTICFAGIIFFEIYLHLTSVGQARELPILHHLQYFSVTRYAKQESMMNQIEQYIFQFEPATRAKLNALRQLFFEVLPGTDESIRYKMPAYTVGKYYLYFAAYKNHIGFYPVYGLTEIEDEVCHYRAKKTKDSLHFMLDKPLPLGLIKKIILLKSTR